MPLEFDPHPMQHCQPDVAERRVLRQHEMLAQFQVGAATGEDGGAIGEVVDGADVRAEGQGGVIEEARSVSFLGSLELVDEADSEFCPCRLNTLIIHVVHPIL